MTTGQVCTGIRWLLIAVFGVSALAKSFSPYRSDWMVGPTVYYLSILVELVIVSLLLLQKSVLGSALATGIAVAGIVIDILLRPTSCGCLGGMMDLRWREHLLFAASVGVLASSLLCGSLRSIACRVEGGGGG